MRKVIDRFKPLFEYLPTPTLLLDKEGRIRLANTAFAHMFSMDLFAMTDQPIHILLKAATGADAEADQLISLRQEPRGGLLEIERRLRKNDGTLLWVKMCLQVAYEEEWQQYFIILSMDDITRHKVKQQELEVLVRRKELLLRELIHRVKNNMAMLSSLLMFPLRNKEIDNSTKAVFQTAQDRINSMAIMYDLLHQYEGLTTINLTAYLFGLLEMLRNSYAFNNKQLEITAQIDHADFHIDIANPLGLIVSELFCNCFKYAYDGSHKLKLEVSLQKINDDGTYKLVVADNGKGFSMPLKEDANHGLQLVRGLTEQIGGVMYLRNRIEGQGAMVELLFNKEGKEVSRSMVVH